MMVRMDAALNYAKTNKKSDVQFYEYFISEELENRVVIEKGLRHALENEEFVLFYQPIICGRTRKIKGFEALIRWKKEDGIILGPGEFMPIAEHMLLMHEEELRVDPKMVEFEITETVLIESLDLLRKQFQPLINLGVRISLDDFGTGYSSLNYLQGYLFSKPIPVHEVLIFLQNERI